MKQPFLKLVMLFLIGGAMLTNVSCSNDDKVNEVSAQVTELKAALEAQKTALEASLKTAQDDIKVATDKANAAKDAADEAAEAAAQASLAAAKAKAEAITEAIAQCKTLIADKANQSDLNALTTKVNELASQIEGIQTDLADQLDGFATIDSITSIQTALDLQKTALTNLETALGNKADKAALKTATDAIDALKLDLTNNHYTKTEIDTKLASLTTLINTVDGRVNTLVGILPARLASVTLVPNLYVGGIPSIEFISLSYKAITAISNTGATTSATAKTIVSDESTVARYRLNPTGVTASDIEMPTFVSTIAATRATTGENTPVKVTKFEITDGILEVTAAKTTTESVDNAGTGKIYTVALKVPVAANRLFEGETEAYVYSEYARLAEVSGTPGIAAIIDQRPAADLPLSDLLTYSAAYASAANANVYNTLKYDESFDLLDMVTGYYGNKVELTKERLADYGLEFTFDLAPEKYELGTNNTDQQQFAKITDGHIINSLVPGGSTNNAAAVDKEPIIRVKLIDVKNSDNIVAVAYFKIKWAQDAVVTEPIDLGVVKKYTNALSCNDVVNTFLWADMTQYVYAALNEKTGMSKAEFEAIYQLNAVTTGKGSIVEAPSTGAAEDSAALTWTLTDAQIGTIVPATSKTYKITLTYEDQTGVRGDVTFSFETTISLTMPSIYGYYSQYWLTQYTLANIYPIQYKPTMTNGEVCEYGYNLMNLFTSGHPIVKDMLACGEWDLQFAKTQPVTGYAPTMTSEPAITKATGYDLKKGATLAADLTYGDGTAENWYAYNVNSNAAAMTLSVVKNDEGKGLIGKQATFKVWATINDYNKVEVTKFNGLFVAPLKVNGDLGNASFEDHVISGSRINCAEAFTMKDFNGYTVAETTTNTSTEKEKYASQLWAYYEVQDVVWDVANAKIGMKNQGGNIVIDDALTADNSMALGTAYAGASVSFDAQNNELVFENAVPGNGVEHSCNIFIKATVSHGWGDIVQWVKVRLEPNRTTFKLRK